MRTLALSILAATALLAASAAASPTRSCGRVNGGFETDITARAVGCKAAKGVARRWHVKAVKQAHGPDGTEYVRSFVCHSHSAGDPEHVIVNCADHTRKVRFLAGP